MPRVRTAAPMLDRLDAPSTEDGLTKLQLRVIHHQLDNLLDEAARANLSARETLAMLCERKIAPPRDPDNVGLGAKATARSLRGLLAPFPPGIGSIVS